MNSVYGAALIAIAVAMILLARPSSEGEPAKYLRVFIVGQAYIMATLVCFVIGATFLISNWPF
jgi:hypothetical protein